MKWRECLACVRWKKNVVLHSRSLIEKEKKWVRQHKNYFHCISVGLFFTYFLLFSFLSLSLFFLPLLLLLLLLHLQHKFFFLSPRALKKSSLFSIIITANVLVVKIFSYISHFIFIVTLFSSITTLLSINPNKSLICLKKN